MKQHSSHSYEQLGLMYLGEELDIVTGDGVSQPLLFQNRHLATHGIIIGMTGSGKTGLGIGLIEEAVMDNVPSIIIDPKGDMSNLALAFPECRPEDFLPWIDPAEAARKQLSPQEYSVEVASNWRNGLRTWGQELDRVQIFSEKQNLTIYTPGSSSGVPVSVLGSFAAPGLDVIRDNDALATLINSTVTGLLGLVGMSGDSLQGREHILMSSVLQHYWRQQIDMTMESLIGKIVDPPFDTIGVFSLETYYPQADRMGLAVKLNNILASPAFSCWMSGEPLDIQNILYSAEGAPRTAVFSIAHLSDNERMFFVTMLLNQFIGWMRNQPGTSSLKALLYMDEVFGFFPPTSNPPSKKPMILLLKQARAYGVGVLLATQNPVDLDYKGLANIGTWFIGRLQTPQDQEKVAGGIVSASGETLNRKSVRKILSALKKRQFLLNSVHLDGPMFFETRWVMSYLKGPVSKADISRLMAAQKSSIKKNKPSVVQEFKAPSLPSLSVKGSGLAPAVSKKIEQLFVLDAMVSDQIILKPFLLGSASVRFYNARRNIDEVITQTIKVSLDDAFPHLDWQSGTFSDLRMDDCCKEAPGDSHYLPLPPEIMDMRDFRSLEKEFSNFLYHSTKMELFRMKDSDFESKPGESLVDFKVRMSGYLRDKREQDFETLKNKYKNRQRQLEARLRKAMDNLDKEKMDLREKKADSILSIGMAVVGAFFGRKKISSATISRTASGIKKAGKIAKEQNDVRRAEDYVLEVQGQIEELAMEIEARATDITDGCDPRTREIETFVIKPRRADIFNARVVLLWQGGSVS